MSVPAEVVFEAAGCSRERSLNCFGRLDTNAGALLVRIPSEAQNLCSLLGTGPEFFPKKKVSHSPALPLVLSSSSWAASRSDWRFLHQSLRCCRPSWLGNRFSIPLAGAAVKHHKEVFTGNLNYATSDCILVFGV